MQVAADEYASRELFGEREVPTRTQPYIRAALGRGPSVTQGHGDVRSEATDSSLLARGDDGLVTSHSTTSKSTVPHYERGDVMLGWSGHLPP